MAIRIGRPGHRVCVVKCDPELIGRFFLSNILLQRRQMRILLFERNDLFQDAMGNAAVRGPLFGIELSMGGANTEDQDGQKQNAARQFLHVRSLAFLKQSLQRTAAGVCRVCNQRLSQPPKNRTRAIGDLAAELYSSRRAIGYRHTDWFLLDTSDRHVILRNHFYRE